MRQKNQVELNSGTGAEGESRSAAAREPEACTAKASLERTAVAGPSMEAVVERENLKEALARVKRNKGAAGIDGMSVDNLPAHLKEYWPTIRAQLLEGTYKPQPVRRVEIPKASGGLRPLGIPTVLDRFIQQAVLQVLQADWDGTLSETSFGFRPGRSAHQAVEQAQAYIASGHGFAQFHRIAFRQAKLPGRAGGKFSQRTRMARRERRLDVDETGQRQEHLVDVRRVQLPVRLGLEREHRLPRGPRRQRSHEFLRVGRKTVDHARIVDFATALFRALDAARKPIGVVERDRILRQRHHAQSPRPASPPQCPCRPSAHRAGRGCARYAAQSRAACRTALPPRNAR